MGKTHSNKLSVKAVAGKLAAGMATAKKVRERTERILDAAKVAGFRTDENPARWRGAKVRSRLPMAYSSFIAEAPGLIYLPAPPPS